MNVVFQRHALPNAKELYFCAQYQLKGHPSIHVTRAWKNGTYWVLTLTLDDKTTYDARSWVTLKDAREWFSFQENIDWCYEQIDISRKMKEFAKIKI